MPGQNISLLSPEMDQIVPMLKVLRRRDVGDQIDPQWLARDSGKLHAPFHGGQMPTVRRLGYRLDFDCGKIRQLAASGSAVNGAICRLVLRTPCSFVAVA